MEQEIIGGRNERRGRGKMCVEGPERLDLEEHKRGFDSMSIGEMEIRTEEKDAIFLIPSS